jgi:hypothetical protein
MPLAVASFDGMQAKQDMEQVKQIAGSAVNKLANMAGRFMNDLSRY